MKNPYPEQQQNDGEKLAVKWITNWRNGRTVAVIDSPYSLEEFIPFFLFEDTERSIRF